MPPSENSLQVPADIVSRVEGAELEHLIRKVKGGATLTQSERQTFTKLSEKYSASTTGAGADGDDPVPVSQDEGSPDAKPTRKQKLARAQVVAEWMCHYKTRVQICLLAAKRWGLAQRTADDLIAEAKRHLSDPRNTSRQIFRSIQVRGLQRLVETRMSGLDARDPLDAIKELSKLLGLNEPDKTDVRQEISTPDGKPIVQIILPDNGRKTADSEPGGG